MRLNFENFLKKTVNQLLHEHFANWFRRHHGDRVLEEASMQQWLAIYMQYLETSMIDYVYDHDEDKIIEAARKMGYSG